MSLGLKLQVGVLGILFFLLFMGISGSDFLELHMKHWLGLSYVGTKEQQDDLKAFLISIASGGCGAYARFWMNTLGESERPDFAAVKEKFVLSVLIGCIIGLFSFFIVKSRWLIVMLYNMSSGSNVDSSLYGVAVISGLSGMLAKEFISKASDVTFGVPKAGTSGHAGELATKREPPGTPGSEPTRAPEERRQP
jgi:hypothetical protein